MSLCKYELKVLRNIVHGRPMPWGAAVGQAIEALKGSGYLDAQARPTDKGRYFAIEVKHGE